MDSQTNTCLIDYNYNGTRQSIELPAKSWAEAQMKLQALKETAWVKGELYAKIPHRLVWIAKLITW